MTTSDITLDTKVWENDYKIILSEEYLIKLTESTRVPPSNINIFINNVWSRKSVLRLAHLAKSKGLIADYFFVDDYSTDVLNFFGLSKEMLGKGYRYSICELTAIFLNDRQYTLHFSGDSLPENVIPEDFYIRAKNVLHASTGTSVVNLMWNANVEEHVQQAHWQDEDFWFAIGGFSDQMYFIKTSEFKSNIYNYLHPDSERYPKHAEGLFEKRIDSYLRVTQRSRATFKRLAYRHQNHPARLSARLLRKYKSTGR